MRNPTYDKRVIGLHRERGGPMSAASVLVVTVRLLSGVRQAQEQWWAGECIACVKDSRWQARLAGPALW
jgi:hypothetical protein